MLKKINFLIFISILAFVSISSISFARISCSSCYIGDCSCSVTECSSGTVYIYSTGDCSGSPDQSYTFSRNEFSWQPSSTKYYVIGLCDNGDTSDCTSVQVKTSTPTTTTTATTTKDPCPINYDCCVSEISYENKLCGTDKTCSKDHKCVSTNEGGGSSIVLIVFLIVVLIAAGVAYFFIIKKRQPKGGYEELYAKWRR